jgi:hypothetical protein
MSIHMHGNQAFLDSLNATSVSSGLIGTPTLGDLWMYCRVGEIPSSVNLMLHADGTAGSTTITDSSLIPKTTTCHGAAVLATTQKKFGTASINFPNTASYTTILSDADFNVKTGDWCLDFWFYHVGGANYPILVDAGTANYNTAGSLRAYFNHISYGATVAVILPENLAAPSLTSGALSSNAWNHVEISQTSGSVYLFTNGIKSTGSPIASSSTKDWAKGGTFKMGCGTWANTGFTGFIDEVRFSKGIGGHTINFTPETSAYYSNVYDTWENTHLATSGNITATLTANTLLLTVPAPVLDHNQLTDLQGGEASPSEYYHLTADQHTIATQAATGSLNGYLSSADWTTFSGKQNALALGNLTAASSKISIGGTGTGAVVGTGVSVDVTEANLTHNNIGSLQGGTTAQYYHLTSAQAGNLLPAVASNNTLRSDGAAWLASSLLYNNSTAIGINASTFGTANKLTVNANVTADNTAIVQINAGADANKALALQAYSATQSANLFECQSSAGLILHSVGATGILKVLVAGIVPPAAIANTAAVFALGNGNAGITKILNDVFMGTGGGYASFTGRASRGTVGSQSALQDGDEITHLSAYGYGATGYSSGARAWLSLFTAENWTDSAQGTRINFATTAPGGTTTSEKLRLWGDGGAQLGGTFTASPGAGRLAIPIATGSSPLVVNSITVNANFNADLLDGYHSKSFLQSASIATCTDVTLGSLASANLFMYSGSKWVNVTLLTSGITATFDPTYDTLTLVGGPGNVIGPATNTDSYVPQWAGTNAKTLKNGLAVGTAANNLVQLDASAKMPAVDISQCTGVSVANVYVAFNL